MATNITDLTRWLAIGNKDENSHMIVVTDTYDYEDYPVFVKRGTSIQDEVKKHDGKDMLKVTEVYSYDMSLEPQLAERRAYNL